MGDSCSDSWTRTRSARPCASCAGAPSRSGADLLKLCFLGSPPAAAVSLDALHRDGHEIRLVVTRPPKRRGRGSASSPTAVEEVAAGAGLPVSYDIADVMTQGAELGIVVAYGRIIKPDILAALPMLNVHFSLLPRWRGAAPVERAILAGDPVTGVCLMNVEEGLDTGAVYKRAEVPIGPDETAAELTRRLAALGADLLVSSLRDGLGTPIAQEGQPTYAAKVEPSDLHLDWSRPSSELHRVVRLGRAWTTHRGKRLLILDAVPAETGGVVVPTGDGGLLLRTVQPEGKKPMAAADWARGAGAPLEFT